MCQEDKCIHSRNCFMNKVRLLLISYVLVSNKEFVFQLQESNMSYNCKGSINYIGFLEKQIKLNNFLDHTSIPIFFYNTLLVGLYGYNSYLVTNRPNYMDHTCISQINSTFRRRSAHTTILTKPTQVTKCLLLSLRCLNLGAFVILHSLESCKSVLSCRQVSLVKLWVCYFCMEPLFRSV